MTQRPFHRPVPLADFDSVGSVDDPVARSETSHATAALLLVGAAVLIARRKLGSGA